MTVDVDLAGRRHSVDVRREGDHWSVTVGGQTVTASVTEIGGRWSLLIGPLSASRFELRRDGPGSIAREPEVARSVEVSLEPRAGGELVVHVDGRAVRVTIDARQKRRRESGGAVATGPAAVVAPMPGRIVKLLVAPGDVVEALQPLVVVEAMKMENELRAPRAGSVTDVRVSEGTSVEANAVLMVIV